MVETKEEIQLNKRPTYYIATAVAVFIFILAAYWFFFYQFDRYTDDAYVEGNQVVITPLRQGFITSIHTDDTFFVKQGQLLIELDETDAKIAFNQAKEKLATTVREICQIYHQTFANRAEIEVRKAELIRATQDFEHRNEVLDVGGVSLEDFEHAEATLRESINSLKASERIYLKELAMIQSTSIANHPLVLAAAQELKFAWVQLYRSKIYSPVDGLVAQRKAQIGMFVGPKEPLMSVIPLDQIWVNANFKETQAKHLKIGQDVKITSDLYGDGVVFHGMIVGLPGGAGNAFSLLPPQNLSGNWIKIVQRLPVRIALDPSELREHPLRIGLSMKATVELDHKDRSVLVAAEKAPTYQTNIYQKEEVGSEELIKEIINQNIDPSLMQYAYLPLEESIQDVDRKDR